MHACLHDDPSPYSPWARDGLGGGRGGYGRVRPMSWVSLNVAHVVGG